MASFSKNRNKRKTKEDRKESGGHLHGAGGEDKKVEDEAEDSEGAIYLDNLPENEAAIQA